MSRVALPARSIRYQGTEVNTCLSCALAACMEAADPTLLELSPVFHYHWARPGRVGTRGLTPRQGLVGARRKGVCLQALHDAAHTPEGIERVPSARAEADGARRKIRRHGGAFTVDRLSNANRVRSWRKALHRGHAVVLGLLLDADYWGMDGGRASSWPAQGPAAHGDGHAVALIGYEDVNERFVVQDSRGDNFGQRGQWFISYRRCASPLILEAFAIGKD